jgi:hypothetical protein
MFRKPMRKTAPSIAWSNEKQSFEFAGVITCEVSGEWSGGIKCWTKVGESCGNQYSLMRKNGKFIFVLEAVN